MSVVDEPYKAYFRGSPWEDGYFQLATIADNLYLRNFEGLALEEWLYERWLRPGAPLRWHFVQRGISHPSHMTMLCLFRIHTMLNGRSFDWPEALRETERSDYAWQDQASGWK